ncbi:MAG: sulfatase-like hydrolase/transferase [Paludibacteraceae bacterium]|nr:sulfatase-like hydrolase/transferase [Paludibacteraceae bacterium]
MRELFRHIGFVLLATLWATLSFVLPDFIDNPTDGWHSVLPLCLYIGAVGGLHFLFLWLLSLNRWAWLTILPLYAGLGAVIAYYRVAFHSTVTPMIVEATLHTNAGTVSSLVSWQLVLWCAVTLTIAVSLIMWRWKRPAPPYSFQQIPVLLVLIPFYYFYNGRLQQSLNQRYPMNVVHSVAEYISFANINQSTRDTVAVTMAEPTDSLDIVVVIGEAARADHLALNGYERNTNPYLSLRTNVVSLPYIYSQHTYTSTSVPHLLTPADSASTELAATQHSFIHYFSQVGYHTAWISNQDYGRTYMPFIQEADTTIFPNSSKSVFVYDEWNDLQLLPHLDSLLVHSHTHNLYIIHCIGSHWYYNIHVPCEWQFFQPITASRIITANALEQVVNSYDNTMVCLDVFLDSLIELFENRCAVVFFQSDHGESLGENGVFLHAAGAEETKHPAAAIWYSNRYESLFPEKVEALKQHQYNHFRTDYLFHTVLSAGGMQTSKEHKELDLFTLDIEK